MKKLIISALSLSLCLGASNSQTNPSQPFKTSQPSYSISQASYKLEDLCDTEIKERGLEVDVFIEKGEKIWDYHEYKSELFGYVSDFFLKYRIKAEFNFTDTQFNNPVYDKPSKIRLEIRKSTEIYKKRLDELRKDEQNDVGIAIAERGIAVINGTWEEFREAISSEEARKAYEKYDDEEKMINKDFILRKNAGNICHEILHCLSLTHPNFSPPIIKESEIPNMMDYCIPKFSKEFPLGCRLDDIQVKLIHSFLAGNNSYKAFQDSGRRFDKFSQNLKKANNLK